MYYEISKPFKLSFRVQARGKDLIKGDAGLQIYTRQ